MATLTLAAGVALAVPGTVSDGVYRIVNTTSNAVRGNDIHINSTASTNPRDDLRVIAPGASTDIAAGGALYAWSVRASSGTSNLVGAVIVDGSTGPTAPGFYAKPVTAYGLHTDQMKPRPKPWTLELRAWCRDRREQLLALCPLQRAKSVYHAWSGQPGNAGTYASPLPMTVAAIQASIQAAGGDVTIWLQRWAGYSDAADRTGRIDVAGGGLLIAPDKVTITSYGAGIPPRFSRFVYLHAGLWEAVPGYPNLRRAKAGVWGAASAVRPKNQAVGEIMRCMATLADCNATPGSWTNDGGVVAVNGLYGLPADAASANGYDVCGALPAFDEGVGAGTAGIRMAGAYGRLDGVDVEGAGADLPNTGNVVPGYSVHVQSGGLSAITNVRMSFARRHHCVFSGPLVCENVTTMGLTADGGSFVCYGSPEVHLRNMRVGPQVIPFGTQPYGNASEYSTQGFLFSHASSDTGVVLRLATLDGVHKAQKGGQWNVGKLVSLANALPAPLGRDADPDGDSIMGIAFDVQDTIRLANGLDQGYSTAPFGGQRTYPSGRMIHIASSYESSLNWNPNGYDLSVSDCDPGERTMLIRSKLLTDTSAAPDVTGAFRGGTILSNQYRATRGGTMPWELYSCEVRSRGRGGNLVFNGATAVTSLTDDQKADAQALGLDVSSNDASLVAAYWAKSFKGVAYDTLFVGEGYGTTVKAGWCNTSAAQRNCAYGGFSDPFGIGGYANSGGVVTGDPFFKEVTEVPGGTPSKDSPLWSSNAQRTVDYDFDLRPVAATADGRRSIGAY